jgi:hypothetical protein
MKCPINKVLLKEDSRIYFRTLPRCNYVKIRMKNGTFFCKEGCVLAKNTLLLFGGQEEDK